ncbi:hypothetical protein KAJ27_10040 [bacterium]|nr:hypothetical protein [bacterium]
MALELKMIFRNKRPRETFFLTSYVFLSMLFISTLEFLPFLKYSFLFIALFSGSMGYLQFAFSWENQYWNFINTNNINIYEYIKTKYFILFHSTNIYLLIALAVYYYFHLITTITIVQFFSIWLVLQGVINPLYLSTISRIIRHININMGIMMNHEGRTPVSFAIDIGFSFLPLVTFAAINQFLSAENTVIIIALPGIFGLLNLEKIFRYTEKSFHELKHQILDKYQ